MHELKEAIERRFAGAVADLQRYLRQPSVAAQHHGIGETVGICCDLITQAGGSFQVLDDCGGNPVIYADFPAGPRGNPNRTLLFYNHYDVQPAEPLDEWTSPAWAAEIREGRLYARGAADNKGEQVVRFTALQALRDVDGGLPCRVKFLIEGEEEVGSASLPRYLQKHKDLFAADACIWEFGGRDEMERVSMVAGVKGMAYLQLWCHGADVDLHSSLGAFTDNAAWRLVQALTTLRDAENNILIEGFYEHVRRPTAAEVAAVQRLPYDGAALRRIYGLRHPFITEGKGQDVRLAMLYEPTCTICGLEAGYYGPGSKTVLPRRAQAKIDCRLVPDMDPEDIFRKVRRHLDKHGFTDVAVELLEGGEFPYRSPIDHPFVDLCVQTAREAYGVEVVLWPNSAGTGPMHPFGHHLGVPIVSTGSGYWNSRAHAPDENVRLSDLKDGMLHMAHLLRRFGAAGW